MADGFPRLHQPGTGPFYPNYHGRSGVNRATSPHGPRRPFATDTPSPSRSPASAMSHNYTMFSQNGFGNQHMMNGGQNHNRFGAMHPSKQHQHHYSHQNQIHGGQQQSSHLGHQHNMSGGAYPGGTPHMAFGQGALQNGNGDGLDQDDHDSNNEYWRDQQKIWQECSEGADGHHRARTVAQQSKGIGGPMGGGNDDTVDDRVRRAIASSMKPQGWTELDLGGQGLRALSSSLYKYNFLTRLDICHNQLQALPAALGELKSLEYLDVSFNQLTTLPEEIGMLVNLRTLLFFQNPIIELPHSIGYLYKLDKIGVFAGPRLTEDQKNAFSDAGTKGLISHCLENMPEFPPPHEREWHQLDDGTRDPDADTFKAITYNILCERYTPREKYGYVPEAYLSWDYRKQMILDELIALDADVVCLQELDKHSYDEFFRSQMSMKGYKAFYAQKSRAETIGDNAKFVDGCGTFWKDRKYISLDTQKIILGRRYVDTIGERGDKRTADMINRVWQRDDIATLTFLENRVTGSRLIVVNSHIYWDPAFKDVKLIQAAVIMSEAQAMADRWTKKGPVANKQIFRFSDEEADTEPLEIGPSLSYSAGNQIPMIVCGDYNSAPNSPVYDLFTKRKIEPSHPDFTGRDYGSMSKDGMSHNLTLKSTNSLITSLFTTNYTPDFQDELDHIFFSSNTLTPLGVLGQVDKEYLKRVPGFPNMHFPSDHLALMAEFRVEKPRVVTKTEADFGPSSRRS